MLNANTGVSLLERAAAQVSHTDNADGIRTYVMDW